MSLTLREMPASERPQARLQFVGAGALSNAELLANVLRAGLPGENALALAMRLLAEFKGLSGLARAGFQELCQARGLGPARAAQLKSALELARRLASEDTPGGPVRQITTPAAAAFLLMPEMGHLEQGHFVLLCLNTKNYILAKETVYIGNVNTGVVRIAEVLKRAIVNNAVAIIVAHNHPSGDPTPSPEDVMVTRQLVQAGQTMDVEVLDHLVIGHGRWVSLKERGLGFD